MEKNIDELNKVIVSTIEKSGAKKYDCDIHLPGYKGLPFVCYISKLERDKLAGEIMAAIEQYVESASWQDDYGGLHANYPIKGSDMKLGFDVGFLSPDKEMFKEHNIDTTGYKSSVMYVLPYKE